MSEQELANWQRIKELMEEEGNTDNMFYNRAVKIIVSGNDPLDKLKLESGNSSKNDG